MDEFYHAQPCRRRNLWLREQLDVVKVVHVVKRPDPDTAFAERLVGRLDQRRRHVVKVDLNRPGLDKFLLVTDKSNDIGLLPEPATSRAKRASRRAVLRSRAVPCPI